MARFYGMITNIDENMGRLTAKLGAWGLAENTILVFMTDNGTAAGAGRRRGKPGAWPGFNAGMRGAKGSEYDGGHRVPLFIRWPKGRIGGGRAVDQLAAHVDVLPTLADLCGLERPAGPPLDGKSLAPLLRGDAGAWPERTLFVHSQRIPYPEKWRKSAVMTEQWRLVRGEELYDIQADPGQKNDLAAGQPAVVARLRKAYDRWWDSLRPVFDESVHIGIGSDAEPVTRLVAHDWQPPSQAESPWNQSHVRGGHVGNGFWAIEVARPGKYEFELRRWPDHVDGPLEATQARLKIGSHDLSQPVAPDATKATFTVDLEPGKTRLQTWLTMPNGKTRGAYFVYIRRVDS
jgi:hypothetical protein